MLVHGVVWTFVFVVVGICVVIADDFVETSVVVGTFAVEQFKDSKVLLLLIIVVLNVEVVVSVLLVE